MRSLSHYRSASALVSVFVCTCLLSSPIIAQTPTPSTALAGGWTLNRERSTAPLPVAMPEGKAEEPVDRRRIANPRGGHGGPGNGKAGENKSSEDGDRGSGVDPKQLRLALELAGDLAAQAPHLVVAIDGATITLEDASGQPSRYVANNKKQKYQVAAGAFDARTNWDKSELHQEFWLPSGVRLTRVFALSPDASELVISSFLSGLDDGVRRQPSRTVYARDEAR